MNLILFFFSYVLSLTGFLLGKSTIEEHIEIKRYIIYFYESLKVIFFGILVYLFNDSLSLIIVIGLLILYVLTKYFEDCDFNKFFNIIFLSISFILFNINFINYLYLILILLFAIILENSINKFYLKEEIYSFVIYSLVYVSYLILVKVF